MASKTPGRRPSQRRADRDRRSPQVPPPVVGPDAPAAPPMVRKIGLSMHRMVGKPCYLCGEPGAFVGTWWPSYEMLRQLLVARGRMRVFVYSLCRRCQAIPNAATLIEDRILEAVAETGERFGTN